MDGYKYFHTDLMARNFAEVILKEERSSNCASKTKEKKEERVEDMELSARKDSCARVDLESMALKIARIIWDKNLLVKEQEDTHNKTDCKKRDARAKLLPLEVRSVAQGGEKNNT